MSSRSFGRKLGLCAVLLAAILLIVALAGGMAEEGPNDETSLEHAMSAHAPLPEVPGAEGPGHHDAFSANDQASLPKVR